MSTRRALLLDGRRGDSAVLTAAHDALCDTLTAAGWAVDDWTLRDDDISFCSGCYGCWVKTPGVCVSRGAARSVAERFIANDLVVLLTPVTFGGYSSELKKALDHVIPVLQPFFCTVDGETHHVMRYATYPDLLAIGIGDTAGAAAGDEAETFRNLVGRNVLNFQPRAWAAGVLPFDASELEVRTRVSGLLGQVRLRGEMADPEIGPPVARQASAEASSHGIEGGIMTATQGTPRTALLLIGSPKPGSSSSRSLGEHLLGLLAGHGLAAETVSLPRALRSSEATAALCSAVGEADIVVLSFPLYVDSLPAPATRALEVIARQRTAVAARPLSDASPAFVAICQSGFPEQRHSETALRICRNFARAAGFAWAGGLAMGGGAMIGGRPLTELGGQVRNQARALELTAEALCEGRPVPDEAEHSMGKLPIPAFAYRKMGHMGWRRQAKTSGARGQLTARPFAERNPTAGEG